MNLKNVIAFTTMSFSINFAHSLGQMVNGGSGGATVTVPQQPSAGSGSSSSSAPPVEPVSGDGAAAINQILTIASNSSCAAYSWKSRGKAPKGYMKGMALTYARSLCRLDDNRTDRRTPASLMSRAQTGNTSKDALAHFKSRFDALGLSVSRSDPTTLRSLYTLGIGLGMRESSGKYCEGWDVSAGSNRPSNQVEAGLFQSSYNSIAASAELKKLYAEYKANKNRCMLSTFKEGVTCRSQSILGSGEGATYQRLNKECPAFAAEYAMVMLRVLRAHYGPINRKEAEVTAACGNMLDQVESVVEANGSKVCDAID